MSLIRKTRESTTMQLLLVPLGLICWKYFTGDIESATQFAQAFGMLMAVWLGREWRSAAYPEYNNYQRIKD